MVAVVVGDDSTGTGGRLGHAGHLQVHRVGARITQHGDGDGNGDDEDKDGGDLLWQELSVRLSHVTLDTSLSD